MSWGMEKVVVAVVGAVRVCQVSGLYPSVLGRLAAPPLYASHCGVRLHGEGGCYGGGCYRRGGCRGECYGR